MTEIITVTEAAHSFMDLIDRVYRHGKVYALVRDGTVVAELRPPNKDLTLANVGDWWESHPRLDPDDAAAWQEELRALRASMELPVNKWDP